MSRSTVKRPIITDINPKSPVSEAYRTLRTNIDFSTIDDKIHVIMVTSAGPGEGKSTTVCNLAVTYAQAGKRVIIIDADLRKPTMHHTFQKTNRWGLSNLLSGQAVHSEVIATTHIDNLELMTSGPTPPNPSEMLSSQRMNQLLQELRQIYDIIIIDCPPALAVTDAQLVATITDGVIFVIDAGKVKKELALKVKSNLEHVKARILGIVLNNVDKKNGDAYYYYYYGNK